MEERKLLCERCRKFVAIKNIKYMPKGDESRIALCDVCTEERKSQRYESKSANKKPYFCRKCNFKFNLNLSNETARRCPFCGRDDTIEEHKIVSANELLQEAVKG